MFFGGRTGELDVLRACAEATRDGLQVVTIIGEPGIGKSTLLARAADDLRAMGVLPTWVRHDPLLTSLPFAGLATAFGPDDSSSPVAETPTHQIERGALVMTSAPVQRGVQRYVDMVEKLLINGPVCLLVDDLQFADAATVMALAAMAHRLVGEPLLLVVASRPDVRGSAATEFLARVRLQGARELRLGALPDEVVFEVAAASLGHAPDTELTQQLRQAKGNPFLAHQIVAAHQTATHPHAAQHAVTERLATLPPEQAALLESAALLGNGFSLAALAAGHGSTPSEVQHLLRDLLDVQLLEDDGTTLSFTHHLLWEAVYERIPASIRAARHLDIARALHAAGASPILVADHAVRAGALAGPEQATWMRAGARARMDHDPEGALAVLDQAARCAEPSEASAIACDRVFALLWANRFEDAVDTARRALLTEGDPSVRTELRVGTATALVGLGRAGDASQHLADVAEDTVDPATRALACAVSALTAMLAAQPDVAAQRAQQALDTATGATRHATTSVALSVQSRLAANALDFSAGTRLALDAVGVAADDRSGLAAGYMPHLFAAMCGTDDEDAEALATAARAGLTDAEQPGLVWAAPGYHGLLADEYRLQGRFSDAMAEAETGLQMADETGSPLGGALCASVVIDIAVRTGDFARAHRAAADADRWLRPSVGAFGFDSFIAARTRLQLAEDPTADVIDEVLPVWEVGVAVATPVIGRHLALLAAVAAARRGDAPTVERVRALLPVYAGSPAMVRSSQMRVAISAASAVLQRDATLAGAVLADSRSARYRLVHADALAALVPVLARNGSRGEATEAYRELRELCNDLGCSYTLLQLQALGQELAVAAPRGRPRTRARTGWASLSATEHEVTRLVAERLTNREIAARLYVSHRTVETHLRSIFQRLGLGSRQELVQSYVERVRPS